MVFHRWRRKTIVGEEEVRIKKIQNKFDIIIF